MATQNKNINTPRPTPPWLREHSLGVPVVVLQEGDVGRSASAVVPGSLIILSNPVFWALVLYTPRAIGAMNQKNYMPMFRPLYTASRRRQRDTYTYNTVEATYSIRVGKWFSPLKPWGHSHIYQHRDCQPTLHTPHSSTKVPIHTAH